MCIHHTQHSERRRYRFFTPLLSTARLQSVCEKLASAHETHARARVDSATPEKLAPHIPSRMHCIRMHRYMQYVGIVWCRSSRQRHDASAEDTRKLRYSFRRRASARLRQQPVMAWVIETTSESSIQMNVILYNAPKSTAPGVHNNIVSRSIGARARDKANLFL